jgi:ribokinase
MAKVVVIGSSNTDMVVNSPKMPAPGETILGKDFSIIPGGKGANQAVAAARAGGDVTFIAKVGDDDFGKRAVVGYKADGIITDYIFVDNLTPSGIAVIIVEETTGQNAIVVASGANGNLSVEEIQKVEDVIATADIVLIQLEIPLEIVKYSLEIAKRNGVVTVLNPAPALRLDDEILSHVDIITPNESETQILTGLAIENEKEVKAAAIRLLEKVNDTVVVTLGSRGVYFISKNGEEGFIAASKVEAVDTTAAGDVFNGFLANAVADGKSIRESIELANKAAAISVTGKGAQPSIPNINDIVVSH